MIKKILINISFYIFIIIILLSQNIKADDLFDQGKIIFMGDGNCATCHSLDDANSNGNIGPNLNEIKPDISRVLMAVTNGIGVMPAYQGQLSDEEINAVATYVVESTN
ncbi:cytochrome c [Candidatus Pelagibacter sp.]|jgi:cytochrome c6|nr:cytochrome c [Candidatus Pelagibacter sp.]